MFKKILASAAIAGLMSATVAKIQSFAAEKAERPRMDLAFCIDTTGSMQGEIDMVKSKMKELVAKLSSGKPAPEIRVGLVAFRDRGDEYVTKVFPFSDDIDKVVKDISGLAAAGGGDGPEAVNQAMHSAVHDLKWDESKKTVKLLFLIGDAGPHAYPGDFNWKEECKQAISSGIQVNTIACDGLQSYPGAQGVEVFQQIAKLTDGKYETLAYRQEVATADGRRETLIRSGGETFKVKAAGKDAWRAGAAALASEGKAEKMVASPAPVLARAKSRGFMPGASAPASAAMYADSAMAGASYGAAMGAVGRADNNLADVLLEGAKKAAEKKIGVEFGR